VRLTSTHGGDTVFALVSTPVTVSRVHLGKLDTTLLMQPRVALLDDLQRHFAPVAPARPSCEFTRHSAQTMYLVTLGDAEHGDSRGCDVASTCEPAWLPRRPDA